jgi:kynureninase
VGNPVKNKAYFIQLDREDPLAGEREKYSLPDDIAYFVGNSLGAMPKAAKTRISEAVEQEWGKGLVKSWNSADWINLPVNLGGKIARLIGADAQEVIVADTTSINLYKIIIAALELNPGRTTVVTENSGFPTDLYILQGIAQLLPERVKIKAVRRQNILDAIDADTALIVLSHVDYRTGELIDMQSHTEAAHQKGSLILWDLCHSAGVIEVALNQAKADFAVGCGYKFLNGGPGAPAFIFVASRWIERVNQPLTGWMGHTAPFEFSNTYEPASTIKKMLTGTHPVLAASSLDGAIDTLLQADIKLIREKSIKLGDLFAELMQPLCDKYGFRLASPQESSCRGSQICYQHEYGYEIMQALIDKGVVGDYRKPNVLRFGFAPVYQRYSDVWTAVTVLIDVMENQEWINFRNEKAMTVT